MPRRLRGFTTLSSETLLYSFGSDAAAIFQASPCARQARCRSRSNSANRGDFLESNDRRHQSQLSLEFSLLQNRFAPSGPTDRASLLLHRLFRVRNERCGRTVCLVVIEER